MLRKTETEAGRRRGEERERVPGRIAQLGAEKLS